MELMDEKEPGLEKAGDKSAPLAEPACAKALRPLAPDRKPKARSWEWQVAGDAGTGSAWWAGPPRLLF